MTETNNTLIEIGTQFLRLAGTLSKKEQEGFRVACRFKYNGWAMVALFPNLSEERVAELWDEGSLSEDDLGIYISEGRCKSTYSEITLTESPNDSWRSFYRGKDYDHTHWLIYELLEIDQEELFDYGRHQESIPKQLKDAIDELDEFLPKLAERIAAVSKRAKEFFRTAEKDERWRGND